MREYIVPCPHHHPLISISRASSDVFSDQPGCGRFTQRLSPHSIPGHGHGFRHASQDDISPRVRWFAPTQLGCYTDRPPIYRFPDQDKIPDFATFSSLFRITEKYELPAVRSQLLKVVRDAYPETFEGLIPSNWLGESVFSGQTPHPNEVLNLFVQQKLTFALPMAYCMAARRGLHSLMDPRHPASARLPPEILKVAVEGLVALREVELKETYSLIFESTISCLCSSPNCTSPKRLSPRVLDEKCGDWGLTDAERTEEERKEKERKEKERKEKECKEKERKEKERKEKERKEKERKDMKRKDMERKIVDRIAGSFQSGTKILQVLSWRDLCGSDRLGFCKRCVEWWEFEYSGMRKKVWAALPSVFGLKVQIRVE